jgi:uncharacterized protein
MSNQSTPIAPNERIFTLDVVRGVALLGIFIMNVPGFNTSFSAGADGARQWPQWWDRTAETLRDVLFSGKFNSMFSMLFAVGFTIQLERLLRRDPSGTRIYIRRITWLLVFGIAHACIFWTGDVLHMYALMGFILIAIRKWPDRLIAAMIVACILYAPIMGVVRFYTTTPEHMDLVIAQFETREAADNFAYGEGSFFDAMTQNTRTMIDFYTDAELLRGTIGFYMQIATTMFIGLLLGRHAFFQNAHAHLGRVKQVQWWALAIGVATGVFFGVWQVTVDNPSQPTIIRVMASTCYTLCRVSLMAFYVATLVRAVHSSDYWRAKLRSFALAGRMPLTNYLGQTLIATFVFFDWGLGLWNQVGPALSLVFAIAIFCLIQVPVSRWWLARHEFGPMEYVWRLLTYGRAGVRRLIGKAGEPVSR